MATYCSVMGVSLPELQGDLVCCAPRLCDIGTGVWLVADEMLSERVHDHTAYCAFVCF